MRAENVGTRRAAAFGPFRLLPVERLLETVDGPVRVGSRALDILIMLVERAGEVISKKDLISQVWSGLSVDEAGLRVHIASLRKALGDGRGGTRYITNVVGRGYSFVAPVMWSNLQEAAPASQPAALDHTHNLPPPTARIVGRDEVVRSITARLTAQRFVSIVGPGGMGKTTVAVSVAHALLSNFNGSITFIDISSLADASLVASTVVSTLGLAGHSRDPLTALIGFLRDRHHLLVLDSCEHLIDAVSALAEQVYREAPRVHILVTSREALRVAGEHVHRLLPLDSPPDDDSLTAAETLAFPAAQLFAECASASGSSIEFSDAEAIIVGEICRKLDGLALAIELVAGRVEAYGVKGIAGLLDNRSGLLLEGRRTALPRHQTLNALLDWSYNLLSEHEQLMLRRLSILVGAFTLDAAQAVAMDNEREFAQFITTLGSLIAKSLVASVITASMPRFRLLDTTRAYAARKLGDSGETSAIAQRHARHFQDILERRWLTPETVVSVDDLTGVPGLLGNVRAALEWSFSESGDKSLCTRLTAAAAPLFLDLSLLAECHTWCERAMVALDETSRETRVELEIQQALAISAMFTKGNGDEVLAAIKRGLELAERLADADGQMKMYSGLNIFLTRIGDFRGAVEVSRQCEAVARSVGKPISIRLAEWMLGVSHHLAGNQSAARQYCESSLAGVPEADRKSISFFGYDHRVRALVALARALWLLGFPDQAARVARQTIDAAAILDQPVTVCIALIYAAPVFIWCGAWSDAEHVVEKLIDHAAQHSLAPYHAVGTALKGDLLVRRGDVERGVDLLRSSLLKLRAERHDILVTVFASAMAEGLAIGGHFDEAVAVIDRAIAQAAQAGGSFDLPELLRIKGQILAMRAPDNRADAKALLLQALEVSREQAAMSWELRAAMSLARLEEDTDQSHQARGMLVEIYERFDEGLTTPDLVAAANLLTPASCLERR